MSIPYQKQTGRKKKDEGTSTSDLLGVPIPSVTLSPSSSISNSYGDTQKKGFRSSIRNLFSSGKEKKQEPTIVTADNEAPKENDSPKKAEDTSQSELHSQRLDANLTEDPNRQWQLKTIDYSMEVMSLFEELSKLVSFVVPNALGIALRTITAILQRLKQMIENNQEWRDMLMSIDGKQRVFNEQLLGIREHEIPYRLLNAMKRYAQSLEGLAARIMEQVDISLNSYLADDRIMRIKAFVTRACNANSDAEDITAYKAELYGVISEVESALTIYTAITVNRIDRKADNLKALIFLEGNNAAERNPLGTKHRHCLKNTRIDILEDIRRWKETAHAEERPVYCIGDMAGTGKSTIAYTMAKEWGTKNCISFFFSNTSGDRAQTLCISFAQQIIGSCYGVGWEEHWAELSSELSSPVAQDVKSIWGKLVSQPLGKCTMHKDHLIVVDALDECDPKTRILLLKCLLKTCSSEIHSRLRLLLTTRKDNDIGRIFAQDPYRETILHKSLLDSSTNEVDIAKYVKHRINKWKDEDFDLTAEQLSHFVKRCGGLFIFASLACGLLEDELPMNRSRRLQDILGEFTSLDGLYRQTLLLAEGSSIYTREPLKSILGAILVSREPLSVASIATLLSQPTGNVRTLVKKLGSILGCGDDDDPVYILHATLKEFLLRETLIRTNEDPNAGCEKVDKIQNEYYSREPESHLAMLSGCLSTMSKQLTFNICRLETSCQLNDQVADMTDRIRHHICGGLRYGCLQWANHLEIAAFGPNVIVELRKFMTIYFLYWLEVLSVTKSVGSASGMLKALIKWMKVHDKDDVMAAEMGKFVTTFASVIAQSAPHIYLSALPFTPSKSPVSKCYLKLYSGTMKVLRGGLSNWPFAQGVFFGHAEGVTSIVFSPDGQRIASCSRDKTVRVWDAETGEAVGAPFKDHDSDVYSVFFSPDGKRVVSASPDGTIRVWDAETGERIGEPFKGHHSQVYSIAFPSNDKTIVAVSDYNMIRVWIVETGETVGEPLKGHKYAVDSIAFSPEGKKIVSGSRDQSIRVWDVESGEAVGAPLIGHQGYICSVAISPDSKRVVSSANDSTIRLWDAETGDALGVLFEAYNTYIYFVSFSPDGKRIASCSNDKTIRVWDAETREAIEELFIVHNSGASSVVFSPDSKRFASGFSDGTIRVWNTESGGELLRGHKNRVNSVAFSTDGKKIVSGSDDHTIQVWDAESGEAIGEMFKVHDTVNSVAFSPNNKRIVSASRDNMIRLWDVETGQAIGEPLEGHNSSVISVAFSPDNKRIVSGSYDMTIRLWDADTGEAIGKPFQSHNPVYSVAFSPDSKKIISGSWSHAVQLWDVEADEAVGVPFEGHGHAIDAVAFSPDGKRAVSGSRDQTVRVWDVETGEAVGGPFIGHDYCVSSVVFSPDSKRIVSGSRDKTIQVWDVETGEAVGAPFKRHDNEIKSIALSPNGERIVSGSWDETIRVWDIKEIQHPSLTYNSRIENGWMVNSSSEYLFWVPPSLRAGFPNGGAVFIIGKFHKTFPDFTAFVYGENWTRCKG